ncbi:MAG: beta-ketoacyl-ACP synthase II [Anaerolineae bacterium]
MRTRVVVTGLGAVTPLGNSAPAMWEALLAGRSGVGPLDGYDLSEFDTRFGAQVKNFDPLLVIDRKEARRTDIVVLFALSAAREALAQSGLEIDDQNRDCVGVVMGTGLAGYRTLLESSVVWKEKGARRVSPFSLPAFLPDTAAATIAIELGPRGPNMSIATACATGTDAIGQAVEMIRRGQANAVIAGGTEASCHPFAFAMFNNMKVLSTRNDAPEQASRPFDADRDGFVLGEGAGAVILERLEDAERRGATILGEIVGYGSAVDAYHMAAPAEDGNGVIRAMVGALQDSGLSAEDVDYINAHGTGTTVNDRLETYAIKKVLGDHAYHMAVSSTKSMMGHLMGAAGAVEAVITLKALHEGVLPPTINYTTPDPDCDLDYVPNEARAANIEVAMSNSIGLGGHNATLVMRRI